jgi:hypothetical protein
MGLYSLFFNGDKDREEGKKKKKVISSPSHGQHLSISPILIVFSTFLHFRNYRLPKDSK